jgi:hypothetical protein
MPQISALMPPLLFLLSGKSQRDSARGTLGAALSAGGLYERLVIGMIRDLSDRFGTLLRRSTTLGTVSRRKAAVLSFARVQI